MVRNNGGIISSLVVFSRWLNVHQNILNRKAMKIETNPSFKYNIAIFVFLQLIVQVSAFTSRTQFSTIPTFIGFKVRESANLSHSTVSPIKMASKEDNEEQSKENKEPHISNVLFIECGTRYMLTCYHVLGF